jgi:hypothetical protein
VSRNTVIKRRDGVVEVVNEKVDDVLVVKKQSPPLVISQHVWGPLLGLTTLTLPSRSGLPPLFRTKIQHATTAVYA